MSMTIFLICVFVVGCLVYRKDKGLLPCYWLLLQTLGLPLVAFLDGVQTDEDVFPAYGKLNMALLFLFMFFICVNIQSLKKVLVIFKRALFIAVIIVFLRLIWETYHSGNDTILNVVYEERIYFMSLAVPIFLFGIAKTTKKQITVTLVIIIIAELILAILNHFTGIHLYAYHYTIDDIMHDATTSGTFRRFSTLGAFLAIVQVFPATSYYLYREISFKLYLAITIAIGAVTTMTGSRTGFYAFIAANLIPLLFNYKSNKKHMAIIIIAIICLFPLTYSVSTLKSSYEVDNGFERILYGIVEKTNKKASGYGEGTDNMTYDLINRYFTLDPLGNGYSAKRNPEVAYRMNNVTNDCILAYYLVDRGWLYFLISFVYFLSIVKGVFPYMNDKQKKGVITIFTVAFIMTITDEGIYNILNFTLIYVYAYWVSRQNHDYLATKRA